MSKQQINQKSPLSRHKEILQDFTFSRLFEHNYSSGQARKLVSQSTNSRGFTSNKEVYEKTSKNGITVYPELLEFIFNLDGVYKKLLFFLMFYYTKTKTNRFQFNKQTIVDFNKFCTIAIEKAHTPDIVNQGLRRLVKLNLIQNEKRGVYMLNPLIGISNWKIKRVLINEYSKLLYKKGKDPTIDMYPKTGEKKK